MSTSAYTMSTAQTCVRCLTVDGKAILSYEAENEYLHSAKGRFGVVAAPNGMDVTLGSVGTKA